MERLWSPAGVSYQWQAPANRPAPETAETSQICCRGLRLVAAGVNWEGGGRSPLKRQVLRTRRPTGLDGATLTRRGYTVRWPHGRAPPDRRRLGLAIYVVRCSASSPAITGASSLRRCSPVGAFRSGRRSFSLEHVAEAALGARRSDARIAPADDPCSLALPMTSVTPRSSLEPCPIHSEHSETSPVGRHYSPPHSSSSL